MPESINPFVENTDGVLTHNGEVRVAKGGVKQKIMNISGNGKVQVMGRKRAYIATIHAKLLPLINFADKGDLGFIKFKNNEAYIVGFKKTKRVDNSEKNHKPYENFIN